MKKPGKKLEDKLRLTLGDEFRRRHGYGMMEDKIKPVHLANALLRATHQRSGDLKDIQQLMTATASRSSADEKRKAVEILIERSRDRWGRLGEPANRDSLKRRVLPLLRRLLASDGATYGVTPDKSSFSVPTASLATPDVSDDHAGQMVYRLWEGAGTGDPVLLRVLEAVSDPKISPDSMDDLTAVLLPLAGEPRERKRAAWLGEDLSSGKLSQVELHLRDAARDLERFELAARANPIAALQRIVLLASLTVFTHASTRAAERGHRDRVPLLIDASDLPSSAIADASTQLVAKLLDDAKHYMARVLCEMLEGARSSQNEAIEDIVARLVGGTDSAVREVLAEVGPEDPEDLLDIATQLLDPLDKRSLPGYVRSLGWRTGLLYPVEKNPRKRVVPTDRTLEVLVLTTFDATGRPLELSDFLDAMYTRWGMVCGGRTEDGVILESAGVSIGAHELADNGERFLSRLEAIGLAKRFADSVAMVGVFGGGGDHAGD